MGISMSLSLSIVNENHYPTIYSLMNIGNSKIVWRSNMPTPFIGFGNDTLKTLPDVKVGDTFTCPHCKNTHTLIPPDNGEGTILFFKCGDKPFLGAVQGKLVVNTKSDVSGEI